MCENISPAGNRLDKKRDVSAVSFGEKNMKIIIPDSDSFVVMMGFL